MSMKGVQRDTRVPWYASGKSGLKKNGYIKLHLQSYHIGELSLEEIVEP